MELYWQLLNRAANLMEIVRGIQELQQGKSKVDVLKRVLSSMEATMVYMQPLLNLNSEQPTTCQIIRSFFRADPITFIKRAYVEICGYNPPTINDQMIGFVAHGMRNRTLFIMNVMDSIQILFVRDIMGFYPTARDWSIACKTNQSYYYFYQEEEIHIPEPIGIEKVIKWNQLVNAKKVSEQFVVDIPQGRFWGEEYGAVITPDHKIIEDASREMFASYVFANKKIPFSKDEDNNIALLYSYYAKNYFHFMFDVVARLHLLQKSKIPINRFVTNSQLPFQDELLSLLGIGKEKRIEFDTNLHFKANHLIIPSYIQSVKGIYPKWACDFLRKELLLKRKVKKIQGYERIYISREKAQHRKVTNEDEVMSLLKQYGFKRVILESEPVTRQIELFHSAEIVVSPLGAGLTNLLFSKPGTKVIEFFSPTWVRPVFRLMSHYMGLDYYYFMGEPIPVKYKFNDYRQLGDDITLNIDKLENALSYAMK